MPKASPSRVARPKPCADRLHRRNRYRQAAPNFDQLGRQYPEFAQCLTRLSPYRPTLDFRDPVKVRTLAKTLLKADFNLDVQIPAQSLCPMIPGRLDYIHCIEDLMGVNDPSKLSQASVCGLDIGTGASCVYPLLACQLHPNWRFQATARANVAHNHLSDRIAVTHCRDAELKLPPELTATPLNRVHYDFCMCNPPYYRDEMEMVGLQEAKPHLPPTTLPGQAHELMTPGGEQQFVTGLIDESLQARGAITWYTSLIGRSTTLVPLTQYLVAQGVTNYAIAELCPSRTRRWMLVWTYGLQRIISKHRDQHPILETLGLPLVNLPTNKALAKFVHHPNLFTNTWLHRSVSDVKVVIETCFENTPAATLRITNCSLPQQIGNSTLYKCDIRQDFWSRRARRRHQCVFSSTTPSNSKLAAAQQELAIPNGLVVWIVVMNSLATPQEPMLPSDRQIVCASESCQTLLLFVKGSDYETFLSLYNHLKRRLSSLNTNSPL